jgi:hypothetical protein
LKIGKIDYLDAGTAAAWSGMLERNTGAAAGCTTGGRAVVFGMNKGPVWPQPASSAAAPIKSARDDFTIRITV